VLETGFAGVECYCGAVMKRGYYSWSNGIAEADYTSRLGWELGVPTIGVIYRKAKFVVSYLNGLMRDFERESLDCSLC